jgi:excinuclease UvrABC ATPase subunit
MASHLLRMVTSCSHNISDFDGCKSLKSINMPKNARSSAGTAAAAMSLKYVDDGGEWFSFTLKEGARQQCCGCGLTHDIEVRRKGRRYQMRILRHERATAAARRARKKTVVIAEN